jgi:hypothetical protein
MAKGLDICRTQGLTSESCNSFYQNLQILYTQHKYSEDHICNSNEIGVQVGW